MNNPKLLALKKTRAATKTWWQLYRNLFPESHKRIIWTAHHYHTISSVDDAIALINNLAKVRKGTTDYMLLVYGEEITNNYLSHKSANAKAQAAREIANGTRARPMTEKCRQAIAKGRDSPEAKAKRRYSNSKQRFIDTYGDDWEQHYNEWHAKKYRKLTPEELAKRNASVQYARTTKFDREKYEQWHRRISHSKTRQGYIDKYGVEKGNEFFTRYITKLSKASSFDHYRQKYGDNANTMWKQCKSGLCSPTSISNAENRVFDIFDNHLDTKGQRQYNIGCYRVDWYCQTANIVVEYFGSPWHGNPLKYDADDVPNPFSSKTAAEIWAHDKHRADTIISSGVSAIYYIWDYYNSTQISTLLKLIKQRHYKD